MNDVRNAKLTKSRTSASLKEFWTDTHSTDSTDTNESGAHSRKFCKNSDHVLAWDLFFKFIKNLKLSGIIWNESKFTLNNMCLGLNLHVMF